MAPRRRKRTRKIGATYLSKDGKDALNVRFEHDGERRQVLYSFMCRPLKESLVKKDRRIMLEKQSFKRRTMAEEHVRTWHFYWRKSPKRIDFSRLNSVESLNKALGGRHFRISEIDNTANRAILKAEITAPHSWMQGVSERLELVYFPTESGGHRLNYIGDLGQHIRYTAVDDELVRKALRSAPKDVLGAVRGIPYRAKRRFGKQK